ncbi:MAG: PEP-CTERM system TPR-repeat protein PrsT [Halioglobus sp.]
MIRLFVKSLAFLSIFLLISCAKDLTPQELIAQARQDIQAGDYASANIALKNAALKEPDNAEARFELAGVALVFGDGLSAEKEARRAIELGVPAEKVTLILLRAINLQSDNERVLAETETVPDSLDSKEKADVLAYRAHALIQQQQFKLAETTIEQALSLNEKSVLAILAKAHYEAQIGRRENAMALAKTAVEIDPSSADVWALIGDLYAAEDKLPEAKEAYDKAIANLQYVSMITARRAFISAQLDDFASARSDIAVLYANGFRSEPYVNFIEGYVEFRQARYPAATLALEKSVEGNPDNPLSKLYLAASYMEEGKLEQARTVANQLYHTIPNSVEVARLFASLNMRQQDFAAAKSTLDALLQVNENDTVALGMLGSMALMEGNGDEAVGYLERLLAITPDSSAVKRMLDLAMTMRGDFVAEMNTVAEQQVAPEEYDEALLSAGIALKQGQLKQALTIAENLQQQYPDKVGPLNMLAAIHLSAGDWRQGKALLQKSLVIDPLDPTAVKTLAKIDMRTGEQARAMELVTGYLKQAPDDIEANGILSELIVATSSYQEAEKQLIQLADKYPDNLEIRGRLVQLYFDNAKYEQVSVRTENLSDDEIRSQPALMELRGKALFNLGNSEGAASVWQKWAKLAPDSVLANFYYADSLVKSNQLVPALKSLEVCRQLNPGYLPARISLIRVAAEAGETEKAKAEMAKLQSELTEERADVWYTQGWLEAKTGDYAAAEQSLSKSLALQPTPETAMLLFATLNSLGKSDEAMTTLEAWVDKMPQNTSLMAVLGQSYMARNESEKAIKVYERILTIQPDSILALNNLAWLNREKDPKQALVYVRQASALVPEDPYVMSTYATLLVSNGQPKEGEEMLRKAVTMHPQNLQTKLDLGRLLLELDKPEAARPFLQEVSSSEGSETLVSEAQNLLETANKGGK